MSRIERIGDATLYLGDCLEILPSLPKVDAVVTDPPYGLKFMGAKWDYDVPSVAHWSAVLEALKPGGHLLAFAGTRTQHRMACAIEDAGFEIRDLIAWVYGNGFPKSLDVSKAIDKAAGAEREVVGPRPGLHSRGAHKMGEGWQRPWMQDDAAVARSMMETAPATDAARQWNGWGTALKPALEPITVARKPLVGTVAENVQAHGTGALNVDACKVEVSPTDTNRRDNASIDRTGGIGKGTVYSGGSQHSRAPTLQQGRWPANLIHDGSAEVMAGFPDAPSGGYPAQGGQRSQAATYGTPTTRGEAMFGANSGSAARFFYCAKASADERDTGNTHPTVKPLALMRYLCMLISTPDAVVLDPYLGSGSTGIACVGLGRKFVGIEIDPAYFEIACQRIEDAQRQQRLFA